MTTAMVNLAHVLVMRGDAAGAESLFLRAIAPREDHPAQIQPLAMLAVLCAEDGRTEDASLYAARARARLGDLLLHLAEGDVQRAEGAVAAAKGDLELAERAFLRAIECYEAPANQARILHQWGRAFIKHGRIEDARAKFDEAIAILREIHYAERYIETIERERDAAGAVRP
jgi:tetratricopeptide (TPR) repeat protein